jgi:hypothetical protein
MTSGEDEIAFRMPSTGGLSDRQHRFVLVSIPIIMRD